MIYLEKFVEIKNKGKDLTDKTKKKNFNHFIEEFEMNL